MAVKNFNFKNPKMADGRHLEKCSVSVPDRCAFKKVQDTRVSNCRPIFKRLSLTGFQRNFMCVCEL